MNFLLLFLFFFQTSPFSVTKELKNQSLVEYATILPDSSQNLTLEDVLILDDSFKPFSAYENLFEINEKSYWIKVELENNTNNENFVITTEPWDAVTVYQNNENNWEITSSGRLIPFNEREIKYSRMLNTPIKLSSNKENIFYIHVETKTSRGYSYAKAWQILKLINLSSDKFIEKSGRISMVFYAFMIGISIALGFYNFIIFLFVKERSYILLSGYLFSQALWASADSGLSLEYILPNNPQYNFTFLSYCVLIMWVFLVLFAKEYLRVKTYFPWYNKYLSLLAILFTLVITLSSFDTLNFLQGLGTPLMLLMVVSLLVISIRTSLKGLKFAYFFLLADIFYIVGILLVVIMNSMRMTLFEDFTIVNLPMNVGAIIQSLLLSFGIAYKVENMRKDLEISQKEKNNLIENQKQLLKAEVQSKTEELQTQNEELLQQSEELQVQRDQLELANREISFSRSEITKSIQSASLTQQAILPEDDEFDLYFNRKFILYYPRDIVSGDFYWLEKLEDKLFLAVVDCTGHGVPGAMMSLIGSYLLSKAINEKKLTNPTEILTLINKSIYDDLRQEKNKGYEGMDLSLCVFHLNNNEIRSVEFAGAKSDLYHQNLDGLDIYKGNRHSLGGGRHEGQFFETHRVLLEKGDTLYFTTDGFIDQNDNRRKKYSKPRLIKLLNSLQKETLAEKEARIKADLFDHQGQEEQRDDITFVALEI